MTDISLGGLSVQVAPDVEEIFHGIERVQLHFRLPDCSEPLLVAARIRSRRLAGTRIRYGLQFEGEASHRGPILGYVQRRRRECLRRADRTALPEAL